MNIEFSNRVVLVTGAVRGVGRAITHGFVARGAVVYATDILADGLEETVEAALPADGGAVIARLIDVTDFADVATKVAEIEAEVPGGRIDILVHCAGGVKSRPKVPIEEVSEADWRAIQEVNLTGAFTLTKAVVPGMKRAGDGRIVVISSPAGLRTSLTGIQSYAAAKAAQIGLVRQLAQELGPYGIRVNSAAPGFMASSPDYQKQWDSYGPEGQAALIEKIALRRLCRPEDIAHAVMFLASDHAGFITGQTLAVNGTP